MAGRCTGGDDTPDRRRPSADPGSPTAKRAPPRAAFERGAAKIASLAVLPFANLSADPDNEFLSDGLADDLITALSRVPGLRVPGQTSCFAFKGKTED